MKNMAVCEKGKLFSKAINLSERGSENYLVRKVPRKGYNRMVSRPFPVHLINFSFDE